MARPSGKQNDKVNKSAEIRAMLKMHPKVQSKEIVAMLAKNGIKVKPSLVYFIKSRAKLQKRRAKRALVAETSRQTGTINPVELVVKVKTLARDAGGIRNLKHLVDVLAE